MVHEMKPWGTPTKIIFQEESSIMDIIIEQRNQAKLDRNRKFW